MEQTLKILQDLQMKAFRKGIHSFEINARCYEDEGYEALSIIVTVFLKGDDSDDDYGRFDFNIDLGYAYNVRMLNNLKAFIGEE